MIDRDNIKELLDQKVEQYNEMGFINLDPISIPHRFLAKQDIEIAAFFSATLAWGQRKTIINKVNELMALMDESPYDFILNHKESDRERFENFKHRTFQYTDTLYFLDFLQRHYRECDSLELAFTPFGKCDSVKHSLMHFHNYFFDHENAPQRTKKHVSTPARQSACKKLNMFLRWMVRKDDSGVDFGIWDNLKMSQLMIPLDVHVARVGTRLGLIERKQRDWKTVEELTENLRLLDHEDPTKYDFALFSMGVENE